MPLFDRLLRAGETKLVKRLARIAQHIEELEPEVQELSDAALRAKTAEFLLRHRGRWSTEVEQRLLAGEPIVLDELPDDGSYGPAESLDELLPEVFAVVREAAQRTIGQRPFLVQLMGGAALHLGNIAEMKTGEGKTLTSVLPVYLNALAGKGVHVVTTNDYLAKRDSENMGRIHRFLGLSVGVILAEMPPPVRRAQYACDITYGTNNEFGFDYLRDNMAWNAADMVQRGHHYAIVDEADSILIDEARTPLIISGPAEQSARWYQEFARMAPLLKKDRHYEVDERKRTVGVTEEGVTFVEDQLGIDNLYEAANTPLVGYLNNALKVKELYHRDKDYIVRDGQVLIVDEFTGRVLVGRRYNEGMHQAIEAKEGVEVQAENQTLATITLQNYFRLYSKLAGMTGTAQTEAAELHQIYKLGVVPIPTNMPMIRDDQPDLIYKTETAKFEAVADDIAEKYAKGQPVLVGTTSVEKSEYLSKLLVQAPDPARGAQRQAARARGRDRRAGRARRARSRWPPTWPAAAPTSCSAVTPSTWPTSTCATAGWIPSRRREEYEAAWDEVVASMKGQVAAEAEEVKEAGGLYVLGTERHESRRIDNQLRGRSGRQGDPGESRFYLSLGDELMRRFNGAAVESIMTRLKLPEDVPIEAGMVTKAIRSAQTQVEQQNFEIRKNVLEVRRGAQQAAHRHLRRAQARARGREHQRADREHAHRCRHGLRRRRDRHRLRRGLGPRQAVERAAHPVPDRDQQAGGHRRVRRGARGPHARGAARQGARRRQGGVRPARGGDRRTALRAGRDARAGAADAVAGDGPQVARAPLRDGLPQGGHRAARDGPARPVDRVPARRLRHVHRDAGRHQGGDGHAAVPRPGAGGARRAGRHRACHRGATEAAAAPATAPATAPQPVAPRHARPPAPEPDAETTAALPAVFRGATPTELSYSGPAEDGSTTRSRSSGNGRSSGPGKGATPSRNQPCPCGSGRKYKQCHGSPAAARP